MEKQDKRQKRAYQEKYNEATVSVVDIDGRMYFIDKTKLTEGLIKITGPWDLVGDVFVEGQEDLEKLLVKEVKEVLPTG